MHVLVPLNTAATYEQTRSFAKAVATMLVNADPKRVTANMSKVRRDGKVFIDWSQNALHQTTACAYSLRAASSQQSPRRCNGKKAAGYPATIARSGPAALAAIRQHPPTDPLLVVLDDVMPGMGGIARSATIPTSPTRR